MQVAVAVVLVAEAGQHGAVAAEAVAQGLVGLKSQAHLVVAWPVMAVAVVGASQDAAVRCCKSELVWADAVEVEAWRSSPSSRHGVGSQVAGLAAAVAASSPAWGASC